MNPIAQFTQCTLYHFYNMAIEGLDIGLSMAGEARSAGLFTVCAREMGRDEDGDQSRYRETACKEVLEEKCGVPLAGEGVHSLGEQGHVCKGATLCREFYMEKRPIIFNNACK